MNNYIFFLMLSLFLCKENNLCRCKKNNVILIIAIKDKYGNYIENANILIKSYYSKKTLSSTTNMNGILVLKNIHPYKYEIIVSKVGYRPKKLTFSITKPSKLTLYLDSCENNRLYGIISDEHSNFIPNALVVLYKFIDSTNNFPIGFTYTDFKGEYNFINIPVGKYMIKAKK